MRINLVNNPLWIQGPVSTQIGIGTIAIQGSFIPGSLSFNNVAVLITQNTTNATVTVSFGLYSLNGSTLSLANSASNSTNSGANGLFWMSLATSATQDITPGHWHFAVMSSTGGGSRVSIFGENQPVAFSFGVYGGNFVHGYLTVTSSALPASIATTDLAKIGDTDFASYRYPYVLISA